MEPTAVPDTGLQNTSDLRHRWVPVKAASYVLREPVNITSVVNVPRHRPAWQDSTPPHNYLGLVRVGSAGPAIQKIGRKNVFSALENCLSQLNSGVKMSHPSDSFTPGRFRTADSSDTRRPKFRS